MAEEKITLLANEKMLAEHSRHDKYLFIALDLCQKYTSDPNSGLIYDVYLWLCDILKEKATTYVHVSRTLSLLADNGILNRKRGFRGNTRIYSLTPNVQNSLHIIYTPEIQKKIDAKIIDLEVYITAKSKQKKKNFNKLLDNY
jgi:Cdc6-like AAA superfamily ATPase